MSARYFFSSRDSSDSTLPFAVYRALIESLFKGAGGNAANVGAYVLLGGFTAFTTSILEIRGASLILVIAGLARILIERRGRLQFERDAGGAMSTAAEVQASELNYLRVITFFALALGVLQFVVLVEDPLPNHQLLVLAAGLVFVVSSPGRCCGSPRSAAVQALSIVASFCAAMALRGQSGGFFAVLMALALLRHLRGMTKALHGTLVTMLMAQRAAEHSAEQFDTALNNMARGLVMIDRDQRVRVANQNLCQMFGLDFNFIDEPVERLLACAVGPLLARHENLSEMVDFFAGRGGARAQWRLADGRILNFSRQPMQEGSVVTIADVTAEHAAEANIQRMARFDPVTGLPNRAYFSETLAGVLENGAVDPRFCLLSVDLDRFKEVNDSHGHHVGDQLLSLAAERMRTVVGATGFVARFGGDEFVILLHESHRALISKIGASIVRALATPFDIDGRLVRIGASVGAALFPNDAARRDAESLLKAADMALYDAKASGRGSMKFFVADMALAVRRRRQLGELLRDAAARGELSVAYQPIVDLESERAIAVEALLRWNPPGLGAITPSEFVPIAEETGEIVDIGVFVLRQACLDALCWPADVRVAVNLSALQFERGDLIETVRGVLAETGLPASRLELEITESILIGNNAIVLEKLTILEALGVHIALDDFGTGYSSLSYLNDFNFEKIKIDQSFVRDLDAPRGSKAQSIIRAVNAIGRDLRMSVVVEGVETAEQLAALRKLGVRGAQGFYFCRPVTAAEIGVYLLREMTQRSGVAGSREEVILPRATG